MKFNLAAAAAVLALGVSGAAFAEPVKVGMITTLSGGQAILVVDKTMDEVLSVADRCVILERGCTVWQGTSTQLTEHLQQRYLGVGARR